LPESDRAAVLLRFFEQKSMEEVGRTLGTTEAAAKMRLARAVEKLRHRFRKRGVVVPTSVVLVLLSAQAAHAAPAGLAASIATSALLNQANTATLIMAKGTLKLMAQAKAKKLVLAALIPVFAGTAAVVVPQTIPKPKEPAAANATATPKAPSPTAATSQAGKAKALV